VFRILLAIFAIIIAFYGLRAFQKASPEKLARMVRILFYSVFAIGFFTLAMTGRLNWLFALAGVVIAFIARMMPELVRYSPYLHRLWQEYMTAKQQYSGQGQNSTASKGAMTVQEAYEVLGLKPGASQQEIIAAHRKLMQKIHPDRGGSDYLAAKINMAKKILIHK
jgi:hypothetical protein